MTNHSRRLSRRRLRASHALRGLAAVIALAIRARTAGAQQDTLRVRPPTRTITLQQAIAIALADNNDVWFARNANALDSLSVRQARNAYLPNLTANGQSSQRILSGSNGQNSLGANASIGGNMTLFNGGQNRNTLKQAQANVEASRYDLGRTRQQVVFTVASAYLNLITQQEQVRVQQENLTAQEEELRQLQEFVNRGTRPIGDLYQQQAAVAQTRLALVNARRAAENAKVDIIAELVLDPRIDWQFETPAPTGETVVETFSLDSLVDVGLRQRVDIEAQRYRVTAAEREIAIAEGGRYPVITGSASFGSDFSTAGSLGFFEQLDASRGGAIGVGVQVPIFDRGAVSIAKQRAKVALQNELLQLRDVEQTVALDVRRAYLDYVAAQEQVAAATAQQEAAALALRAAQARYRVGSSTFIEVTTARAQLIQAQSAVVSARSAVIFQRALMSYFTGSLDPSTVRLDR